jgi:hypothetical protein
MDEHGIFLLPSYCTTINFSCVAHFRVLLFTEQLESNLNEKNNRNNDMINPDGLQPLLGKVMK